LQVKHITLPSHLPHSRERISTPTPPKTTTPSHISEESSSCLYQFALFLCYEAIWVFYLVVVRKGKASLVVGSHHHGRSHVPSNSCRGYRLQSISSMSLCKARKASINASKLLNRGVLISRGLCRVPWGKKSVNAIHIRPCPCMCELQALAGPVQMTVQPERDSYNAYAPLSSIHVCVKAVRLIVV
jgi:hypothetical protein